MPRRSREDEPGSILHIYNRGLGKRTVFENRSDVRYFLSRLAREHRRGRLLVHAYVVLANHFHLIAESPRGEASEAMRVIQNQYVRRFNRLRMRDGPLFRGRFGSRRVRSVGYWWTLLRYIDLHPEKARITAGAEFYPYGSAYYYVSGRGPRWLTRERVERLLTQGLTEYSPSCYERLLARPLHLAEREIVKLRMRNATQGPDPLDDLLTAGLPGLREWMVGKARNADGTTPGIAVVAPASLMDLVAGHRRREPEWAVTSGRQRRDGWALMLTGLLRDACALSYAGVAARVGISPAGVHSRIGIHRRLLVESAEYSLKAAALVTEALAEIDWRRG